VRGAEGALRRLDGVIELRTDLQRNVVEIDAGPALDLGRIAPAVRGAGFRPAWMWVRTRAGDAVGLHRIDTSAPAPAWEVEPRSGEPWREGVPR